MALGMDKSNKEGGFLLIKESVYETLYLCAKGSRVRSWWFYTTVCVDFLQLLVFPVQFALRNGQAKENDFQEYIATALSWISLTDGVNQEFLSTLLLTIAYGISASWVIFYLGLMVFIGFRFCKNTAQSAFSLKLLRSMTILSSTVLFLPFVSFLLQTFQCGDRNRWVLGPGSVCFGLTHIIFITLMAMVLPCFILVSIFIASVFFERDFKENVINAQIHGRGEMVLLVIKVMLSLLFGIFPTSLNPWILQLFLFASSLAYLYVHIVDMPFMNFQANEAKCATAGGYFLVCWVPFCVLLKPDYDVVPVLLLAFVMGPIIGALLCRIRHTSLAVKRLCELHSSSEISVWARKRIQVYERLKTEYLSQHSPDDSAISEPEANQTKDVNQLPHIEIRSADPSLMKLGDEGILYHRLYLLFEEIEKAYRILVERYPSKGPALLEASAFFRHYHNNLYMEMLTLSKAHKDCEAFDTQFIVYQRLKQLREGDTSETPTGLHASGSEMPMNAVDRVLFDQTWRIANDGETSVRKHVYQIWQSLVSEYPDLAQIQKHAENLSKAMETTEQQYKACIRLDSRSAKVLRAYGKFLKEMKGHTEKASEYLNKADRIQESLKRNKQEKVDKFSVYHRSQELEHEDESSAVVITSGDPNHIDEILEVNAAACHLFAKTKAELVGSNLATIIPYPFSKVHHHYVKRFAKTGKSFVINTTRWLLGRTGSNLLIPLVMHFREVPPDQQHSVVGPRFSAVMHSPKISENLLLFDNESNNFMILHADSRSYSMLLGIHPMQLATTEISLCHYLPQLTSRPESKQSTQTHESSDQEGERIPVSSHGNSADRLPCNEPINDKPSLRIRCPVAHSESTIEFSENNDGAKRYGDTNVLLSHLNRESDYAEISTANIADSRAATILARVQPIHVPDYGIVYLLAWRLKRGIYSDNLSTQDAIMRLDNSCHTLLSREQTVDGEEQASASGSPPFRPRECLKATEEQNVHDGRTTENDPRDKRTLYETVPAPGSISPPGYIPESQEETKTDCQDRQRRNGPELPSLDNLSPYSPQDRQNMRKRTRGSMGASSTSSTRPITHLLQHILQSGTSGLKCRLRIRRLMATLFVFYAVATVILSVEMRHFHENSSDQAINVRNGGLELTSYSVFCSSISQMFISNSPYEESVPTRSELWETFKSQSTTLVDAVLESQSHSRDLGGVSYRWALTSTFEVKEQLNRPSEVMPFEDLREFAISHVRKLQDLQNLTTFDINDPPHSATVLLENSKTTTEAMESSLSERVDQFLNYADRSLTLIGIITFTVLSILCTTSVCVIGHSLYSISFRMKTILKTFLLLTAPMVKRLRDDAAACLRDHLQSIKELEFTNNGESIDDGSLSFDDDELGYERAFTGNRETYGQVKFAQTKILSGYPPSPSSKVIPETRRLTGNESRYQMSSFRQHKDSSRTTFFLLVQASSPIFVLIAWSIFMHMNATNTVNSVKQEVGRIRVTYLMFHELAEYQNQINFLTLRMSAPRMLPGNASQTRLEELQDQAEFLRRSILEKSTVLVEGGDLDFAKGGITLDALESGRSLYRFWRNDGCTPLLKECGIEGCQDVSLEAGFLSFLRHIFNKGNEIVDEMTPLTKDNDKFMKTILNSKGLQSKLRDFNSLFSHIQFKSLSWIADNHLRMIADTMRECFKTNQVSTAVCVILFFFLAVVVSVPVMRKLTQTFVACVGLLVLIPESLIRSNRALREQVRDVTRQLAPVSQVSNDDAAIISMLRNQ